MSSNIPTLNFVGMLQEKCSVASMNFPEYVDGDQEHNKFVYTCRLKHLTTKGQGLNKKIAKQNAAKQMLEEAESENLFDQISPTVKNQDPISKLNNYCMKEKMNKPIYMELPEDDGSYTMTCTFDGFTGQGKSSSKKSAKEKAAEAVVKHFNLFKYFENMNKVKERKQSSKSAVSNLYEYCQRKNLQVNFSENTCNSNKKNVMFTVKCSVGDLLIESVNSSKKLAKEDVATKMLHILTDTPAASPTCPGTSGSSVVNMTDRLDSDECPLAKRIKTDQ